MPRPLLAGALPCLPPGASPASRRGALLLLAPRFPRRRGAGLRETQLAARVTVAGLAEGVSLSVYGENLTDKEYYTFGQNALAAQGVAYSYIGRPREYGVTASFAF